MKKLIIFFLLAAFALTEIGAWCLGEIQQKNFGIH